MPTRQEIDKLVKEATTIFPLPINPQKPGYWYEADTGKSASRRAVNFHHPITNKTTLTIWTLQSKTLGKGEHLRTSWWWESEQCSYRVWLNEAWSDGPYKVDGISYSTFERATVGKNGAMMRLMKDIAAAELLLRMYAPEVLLP